MARLAVFHNTLDFHGGADVVCLQATAALSREHDVTLYTMSETDPGALADRFDVPFDAEVLQPPGGRALASTLNALGPRIGPQLAARTALLRPFLQRHAHEYDAVVSTANELALDQPSLQYVHFPQFHLDRTTAADPGHLDGLWSSLAAPTPEVVPPRTRLLANSAWTADVVEEIYGVRPIVCHPPVDRITGRPWGDREPGILVLGRIAPDKRTLDAIAVLDRLRDRGYDLTGHVVGSASPAYRTYVDRVTQAAATRPHVTLETDASRDRVLELLGRYRYGLNMKRHEHFGMAVAEFVAAGVIPFAPDDGGQADVLAHDDRLLFDAETETATVVDARTDVQNADNSESTAAARSAAADLIADAIDADTRPFLPRDRFDSNRFADAIRDHVTAILK
jgi:glycosyltransferase involved in cell wall biosynthesis